MPSPAVPPHVPSEGLDDQPAAPHEALPPDQGHPEALGFMQVRVADALAVLPGPPTARWPNGVFDRELFRKDGVSVSIFAPRGEDFQTPHNEDELYLIASGRGVLLVGGGEVEFGPGDLLHVPAGMPHRFAGPLEDLVAWVIFLPGEVRDGSAASN